MNRTTRCISKWAAGLFAAFVAIACSPSSRAENQPVATTQPAASAQPTSDQRLQELEKEVSALQQEISALKTADTPGLKTATYSLNPPRAEDAPAKVSFASLLGPTTISGFVDGYYSFNFNQPGNLADFTNPDGVDGNTLRFFDESTNQFSLNAVELVVDKAPDATPNGTGRAGYHIGMIYGQAAETINGTTFNGTSHTDFNNIALKEAYVDYIAPIGSGLTLTLGKFVTPAGAEVIETNGNWNYSRSVLFYYAVPFFHFGASAKYTFSPKLSMTGYLVNGWNNTTQFNTGKTYGVNISWTPNAKWSIFENYMAGPQCDTCFAGFAGKRNDNWRQLEDATISFTPNMNWAFILNGDYAYGDRFGAFNGDPGDNSKPVSWYGIAPYVKYTFGPKAYAALRYEYFSDPDGFLLPGFFNNGHVQEATATFAYNLTSALQTRFEFRDDWSNHDIFMKGSGTEVFDSSEGFSPRFVGSQPVLTFGFIYTFSSANAK